MGQAGAHFQGCIATTEAASFCAAGSTTSLHKPASTPPACFLAAELLLNIISLQARPSSPRTRSRACLSHIKISWSSTGSLVRRHSIELRITINHCQHHHPQIVVSSSVRRDIDTTVYQSAGSLLDCKREHMLYTQRAWRPLRLRARHS